MSESIEEKIRKLNELTVELHQRGEYGQAVIFAEQALNLTRHLWGDEHPHVATSLNNLAGIYKAQGRYTEAEHLYEKALNLRQHLLGGEHPDVTASLNNLALLYHDQGRYGEAEQFYEQALNLAKHLWGNEHPHLAASLNNLALLYHQQGRYEEAERLYEQALKLIERLLGNEHLYMATSLNNLAGVYRDRGRYEEAEHCYEQGLELMQHLLGNEHPDVATTLNNLAGVYHDQGRYSEAEPLYKKALALRQRLLGDEHPTVACHLNNLAGLYHDQGRYEEAEPLYKQALVLRQRLFRNEHPDVANSLDSLAGLYYDQGRYSDAELLYGQALVVRRHLLGDEHPAMATSLNNLAGVYHELGRYRKAESLLKQALVLRRRLLGDEHPDVANSLNNLAEFYRNRGRYSEAEPLLEQALNLRRRLLGDEHPSVANTLNSLASLYYAQGRYSEVESLLKQALSLTRHLLGDEHPDVANTLNSLASLYYAQGCYSKAEPIYEEAIALTKCLLGKQHPNVATSLSNLAVLLAATNRPTEALAHLLQSTKIYDRIISQVFATSSENDRLAYLQKIRGNFDIFLSLLLKHLSHSTEAVQAALDLVLKRKALTAAALAAQNQAIYSGRYPHLSDQFQQLRSLSDQIVHLTFSPPKPNELTTYQKRLAQLEAQYNALQKRLASQLPEIQLQEQPVDRCAVALELSEGVTLVEFVSFRVRDFNAVLACGESQWQPSRYLAFILPAGQPDNVQMIDLGETEHIDRLIQAFRKSVSLGDNYAPDQMGMRKKKTAPASNRKTPKYQPPPEAIELYQAIFNPIRPYLGAVKQLLLAADGNLSLVPFKILPTDETGERLLMDEYNISYLSAGRDILRSKIQTSRLASQALIIADPDFDLKEVEITEDIQQSSPKNPQQLTLEEDFLSTLGNKEEGFSRVIGTRLLGESVPQMLKVPPVVDKEALESRLKTCQSPSILLIATHGVFFSHSPSLPPSYPNTEQELFSFNRLSRVKAEDSMLRSALAFAGANAWLQGKTLPKQAGKGIVFAQDVAALDLWATELVVLSACNTAMGDIKIGEGVFGLRRAFAVAGAKTLVMSLWSVPDRATALLMERFFTNLHQGLGRADALQDAQNYIRTITVKQLQQSSLGVAVLEELQGLKPQNHQLCQDDRPLEHPYFWGAWVCQGDTTAMVKS